MSLIEHLREASRHLKEAAKLSSDYRVREAAAGAGTAANCAIHLQERIASGKTPLERKPSFETSDGLSGS
jgi:hypothetical protein